MGYQEQIKNAILDRISLMKHAHKRDIKRVIDQIKQQYLWNSGIKLQELRQIVAYLKRNWHELKNQAKTLRKGLLPAGVS